jgi:glyoxylase-like metal-dependent hydrolase (beta-lactamase superfamily II)
MAALRRNEHAGTHVTIVATLGHTREQISGVLEDGPQSVFFAGDTCYTEAVMLDQAIDGVAPDEGAARETLHRIRGPARQQPLVYLLSHDPGAVTRSVALQVGGGTPGDE